MSQTIRKTVLRAPRVPAFLSLCSTAPLTHPGASQSQPEAQTLSFSPAPPEGTQGRSPANTHLCDSTEFPPCAGSARFCARTEAGLSSLPQALRAAAEEQGSHVLTCSTGERRALCLPGALRSHAPQLSAPRTSPQICIQGPIAPPCTTEMQKVQTVGTNLHLSRAAPGHAALSQLAPGFVAMQLFGT